MAETVLITGAAGLLGTWLRRTSPPDAVRPRDLWLSASRAAARIGWDPSPVLP